MGVAATVMFGTALVTFMTSSLRGPPFGRLVTRLWSGAAGRVLFRIAGMEAARTRPSRSPSPVRSAGTGPGASCSSR